MLSIRNRPSESVMPSRSVPSSWIAAPMRGKPWMLSTATPWRYPVVIPPGSPAPDAPDLGAAVLGGAADGFVVGAAGALGAPDEPGSGVTLGRDVGPWAASGCASRSAPSTGAMSVVSRIL